MIPRAPSAPSPRVKQLFDAGKPEYRVPLVSEIARFKRCGLKVATTFAGCGGSSLGYRMAGFEVVWANEFVPVAQESYRANMAKGTILDGRDIKEIKPSEILRATGLVVGELDLLDGSPPCQAFSTAGKREKGWGQEKTYEHGAKQKNEDLFFEFVRLRDGLMPRAFAAENVSGLVKGTAKGYFIEILKRLQVGYDVEARLLDAQWLGVPQARQRIIFVGVRKDLGVAPAFPTPLAYRYSVRDAIPWIGRVTRDEHGFTRSGEMDLEAGAPSVATMCSRGSYQGHDVETRAVHDRRGGFKGVGDFTDRPAPTLIGSGGRNVGDLKIETRIKTGRNGSRRHPEEGRVNSMDDPMPSVLARGGKDKAEPQFYIEETRVVHRTHGQHKSFGDITDRPSRPVVAGKNPFDVETRVMHDTGRKGQLAKDILDRPCPTITAGPNDPADGGGPRSHFRVELVGNSNATHSRKGERRSVDKPAPTVMSRRSNVDIVYRGQNSGQRWGKRRRPVDQPSPAVSAQGLAGAAKHQVAIEQGLDISDQAIGAEYDKLNPGQQSEKYFSLVRADQNKPSPTIAAAGGQNAGIATVVHPTEKRKFTIAELKRICAFPDDFVLVGTYGQQWERLGNSVPPVMMRHIAEAIRDRVLLKASAQGTGRSKRRAPAQRS